MWLFHAFSQIFKGFEVMRYLEYQIGGSNSRVSPKIQMDNNIRKAPRHLIWVLSSVLRHISSLEVEVKSNLYLSRYNNFSALDLISDTNNLINASVDFDLIISNLTTHNEIECFGFSFKHDPKSHGLMINSLHLSPESDNDLILTEISSTKGLRYIYRMFRTLRTAHKNLLTFKGLSKVDSLDLTKSTCGAYFIKWFSSLFEFDLNATILISNASGDHIETFNSLGCSGTSNGLKFYDSLMRHFDKNEKVIISLVSKPKSMYEFMMLLPIVLEEKAIRFCDAREKMVFNNLNGKVGEPLDVFMVFSSLHKLFLSRNLAALH